MRISQKVHLIWTRSVLKKNHLNGLRHMKVMRHMTPKVKPAIALLNMNSIFTKKAWPARQKVHTANIREAVYTLTNKVE